jgi:hypothetical protein
MTQTARVMDFDELDDTSPEAVHAARQTLVVGATQ